MPESSGNRGLYEACKKKLAILKKQEVVCWFRKMEFPTGHLNIVSDILKVLRSNYRIIDKRKAVEADLLLRWNNKPFQPRYYQQESDRLMLTGWERCGRKCRRIR